MRIFHYQDDEGIHKFTEEDIRRIYFTYWSEKMRSLGKEHLISFSSCIEDWVTTNDAIEQPYSKLDPELYQKKLRWVKCENCNKIYKTDLPGPMCPDCHTYCLTLLKSLNS